MRVRSKLAIVGHNPLLISSVDEYAKLDGPCRHRPRRKGALQYYSHRPGFVYVSLNSHPLRLLRLTCAKRWEYLSTLWFEASFCFQPRRKWRIEHVRHSHTTSPFHSTSYNALLPRTRRRPTLCADIRFSPAWSSCKPSTIHTPTKRLSPLCLIHQNDALQPNTPSGLSRVWPVRPGPRKHLYRHCDAQPPLSRMGYLTPIRSCSHNLPRLCRVCPLGDPHLERLYSPLRVGGIGEQV